MHRRAPIVLGLAVLLVFGVALAKPVTKTRTVVSTDFVVAGISGVGGGSGTINLAGVSGTITQAYLFWHGINNSGTGAVYDNATITFAGSSVTGVAIGDATTNCWGSGSSRAFRADVTAFVTGNGAYLLEGLSNGRGHNCNGASLVVLFNDGVPGNNRDLVFFEGNDSNYPSGFPGEDDGWHATLNGIEYRGGQVFAQLHLGDGQDASDNSLTFTSGVPSVTIPDSSSLYDGNTVPTAGTSRHPVGQMWDIHTLDITGAFGAPGTYTLNMDGQLPVSDCLGLVALIMDLEPGSAPSSFDHPPTPDCGSTLSVTEGSNISYTVQASDPDPADNVTLDASGTPAGATHTPSLPIVANPASTMFSWTPGEPDIGLHTITYTATDPTGVQDVCRITIKVEDDLFVDLASFELSPRNRQVVVNWETALEIDNQGFYVWRTDLVTGAEARVSGFLPALAANQSGARYQFTDATPVNGVEYAYSLEDVDIYGVSTRHPGSVTVANPLNSPIRLVSPAYGARVEGETSLTLRFESGLKGRHYGVFSADPTFADPLRSLIVPAGADGTVALDAQLLVSLGQLAAPSNGVLYWRVANRPLLTADGPTYKTSETRRLHVTPLYAAVAPTNPIPHPGGWIQPQQ
jgi:hypothetical protein